MHHFKIFKFSTIVTLLTLSFVSCKKFVQIEPPVTQLVTESVFDDNATATAAQTAVYTEMFGKGGPGLFSNIELLTGWSADEFVQYSNRSGYSLDLYTNTLNAANDGSTVGAYLWSPLYSYIYQENSVIESLSGSTGVSKGVVEQLIGEAEFVRALCYFYLTNLYGDVPLLASTNYAQNSIARRTNKTLVYQQIVQDLKSAQNLLNSNFVDLTDTTITAERVRPTKWTATALLARVYLYTGDYQDALTQSSAVISNTALFNLVGNLSQVFLANSQEAIWQLQPPPTVYYTPEGLIFVLLNPPGNSSQSNSVNQHLLSSFEPGDGRRSNWIDSLITSNGTYYFPYKYKSGSNSTTQTEFEMIFRLAEQYLIRAESEVRLNDLADATTDLNTIRTRAGLLNTTATTSSDLLAAIEHETQVELFSEGGDRWLNLKRLGLIDSVMTIVNPLKGGSGWQSYQQLYPIPITDIQNDPNLTQTPGY